MEPVGKVHEAVAAAMAEVGGVAKGRSNNQQGYRFRGVADIYLACQPVMAKHKLHFAPFQVLEQHIFERKTAKGSLMMHIIQRVEFRMYHADGSWFPIVTTGEAMDAGGDKACGKCMSYAAKYALIQAFALPEEDPEVDTEAASPDAVVEAPKAETRQRSREGISSPPQTSKAAPATPPSSPSHPIEAKLLAAGIPKPQVARWQLFLWDSGNWRVYTEEQLNIMNDLGDAWIAGGDDGHAAKFAELKERVNAAKAKKS
jgi:hypothetical protein